MGKADVVGGASHTVNAHKEVKVFHEEVCECLIWKVKLHHVIGVKLLLL